MPHGPRDCTDISCEYCENAQTVRWAHSNCRLDTQELPTGDIEVVCIPLNEKDIFGNTMAIDNRYCEVVRALGERVRGDPEGRYCQRRLLEGINVDIFHATHDACRGPGRAIFHS